MQQYDFTPAMSRQKSETNKERKKENVSFVTPPRPVYCPRFCTLRIGAYIPIWLRGAFIYYVITLNVPKQNGDMVRYIYSIYAGICSVHAKCTFKGRKDWGRCKDHSIQLSTHAAVKSFFLRVRILPTEK